MNYRNEITILLNDKASRRIDKKTDGLFGKWYEKKRLEDNSLLLHGKGVPYDADVAITDWLDTLDGDDGETFEVLAIGRDYSDIEHFSNTLDEDRLSVEVRVKIDGTPVDDIVPEGGKE